MITIEQLQSKVSEALKAKDQVTANTYRGLLVVLQQLAKDNKGKLAEDMVVRAVKSEVKKRQEALETYAQGGRQDLANKEKQELALLEAFLPEQMPEAEIEKLVNQVVERLGADSPQQMGQVMGEVMKQVAGKADGSLVNRLVKARLSG
ncbi:MAG: glutamyl-tRNA amidotransferase [Candidatus Buchananbacteria bacterium CG10_big_fil_rev_8_21_14_0_10_42_9]|uniref:Glutamyl-tRNA amidotransferase n=1 Tax=Candidatus Buchananbacteria bacterium CG10_big_fil_rev_8_21_14_0_10_42_9 TaxID=1974526 RepID=A0A2H0W0X0_9BACT|nr:MAG: glutamyl-tRNA amidotransferase [Candidatus Buchananbacteria bacterium CG10_big_fil_rev_8_21_14_0_10_42_9]